MRLWAYRFSLQPDANGERIEHFSCMSACRKQGTAELSPTHRRARLCALPGFDTSTWTGGLWIRVHMGRPRDYSREGKGDWAAPVEPQEAGCPGAWYRTAWIDSILRYRRRRGRDGGRIENPLLTRCDDELVLEAVQRMEALEDEFIAQADALAIRRAQERN